MNILTIIRQIPDTSLPLHFDGNTNSVDFSHSALVCNPFDEYALELAAHFTESRPEIEGFTAVAVGTDKAKELLYTAVAVGATRAIHLHHEGVCNDMQLAASLVSLVKNSEFNLILCGRLSITTGSDTIGITLAEHLEMPCLPASTKLSILESGDRISAQLKQDGQLFETSCPLPAVVTCDKGLPELRIPPLRRILAAKKTAIEKIPITSPGECDRAELTPEMSLPPSRPPCQYIEGSSREMAQQLTDHL